MSTEKKLNFVLILGSTRDGRMGERVMKVVQKELAKTPHSVDLIDPLVHDIPVLRQPLHFYSDPSLVPKVLVELNERIKKADVYLIVTPEYNRMVPPAVTNLLNHFPPSSFSYKASGIISYSMGSQGGAIANVDLRRMLVEFGAPPCKAYVTIPEVHKAIDEAGNTNERILKNVNNLITDVVWWGTATKQMRDCVGCPKEDDD